MSLKETYKGVIETPILVEIGLLAILLSGAKLLIPLSATFLLFIGLGVVIVFFLFKLLRQVFFFFCQKSLKIPLNSLLNMPRFGFIILIAVFILSLYLLILILNPTLENILHFFLLLGALINHLGFLSMGLISDFGISEKEKLLKDFNFERFQLSISKLLEYLKKKVNR